MGAATVSRESENSPSQDDRTGELSAWQRPQSSPRGAMPTTGRETMRADARLNREYILQAAHDAFAESDAASLNSIAKRAGVGPATLYRHFPTREALILALYPHDAPPPRHSRP